MTEPRRVPWDPTQPFNQIPPLPPPQDIETLPVLKQCIAARAALAGLKQAAELIPDQEMLIRTLPILEARASSEIENVVTTTDRLFRFREADTNADPATKEALRHANALMCGFAELRERPLTTATAETVCTRIRGTEMRIRHGPGTAFANDRTGAIIYTPPQGESHLRDLLGNWEQFIHAETPLDPLVCLAISHYQFEAIHPFTDGNGRTGRVINSLYLIEKNLLTLPILYLSRYIIQRKEDYYRLLLRVTAEQTWEEWVIYILRGIEETAVWTAAKIAAIRELFAGTKQHVKQAAKSIYSHELINLIFERPYCRIGDLETVGIAKRQAASNYLKALVACGILEEITSGREKIFVHPRLLELLTREGNGFHPFPNTGLH